MKHTTLLIMFTFTVGAAATQSVAQTYHPTVRAQSYDNAFSIMQHNANVWRNDFYNDIIRANASKGSFGRVSSAQRITQQEIQALCGPFPCSGPKPSIMGGHQSTSVYAQPQAPPQTPAYSPPAPRQYPISATDFLPAGGRILPEEISRNSQGTAEEKQLLRMISDQSLDALEKEGRKNNVANAFGLLTSVSMQIVLGRDLTDAEEKQLITGFNNALAHSPQFATMSARDKQLLYEAATIVGGMMAFLHVQGKEQKDPKLQADARAMARAVLASLFGIKVE